jgi:hypothetical protein
MPARAENWISRFRGRRHYCGVRQRTAFAEHGAFSPRVPVAITNEAASRIATVSAAATSMTGVFMFNDRD